MYISIYTDMYIIYILYNLMSAMFWDPKFWTVCNHRTVMCFMQTTHCLTRMRWVAQKQYCLNFEDLRNILWNEIEKLSLPGRSERHQGIPHFWDARRDLETTTEKWSDHGCVQKSRKIHLLLEYVHFGLKEWISQYARLHKWLGVEN